MIRHSQSYLFGAISGTAVIAAAVVCFILFVSAQALRDWPISNLNFGGGNESAAVAPAESLGGSSANAAATNLNGPVTATPPTVAAPRPRPAAAPAPGLRTGTMLPGRSLPRHRSMAAAVSTPRRSKQPPSTSPAPAPTSGSAPPAGSGTASPSPSGGRLHPRRRQQRRQQRQRQRQPRRRAPTSEPGPLAR